MGGGKGDSKTENTIRYAPYLEDRHKVFLDKMAAAVNGAMSASPYASHTDWDAESAFFGAGYTLASYPSLYDMYGKFMAGLDVEVLFDQIFDDTINGTVVNNAISQEAERLTDEIEEVAAPRLETGLRDINSVMSSSFIIARELMETERLRTLAKFSANLKVRLMPVVVERWSRHLQWNDGVVEKYAQILKLYISQRMDVENHNYEIHAKDVLWPFNSLQYETAALNALSGATNTTSEVAGASRTQKVIGGALTGAASGAMMGSQIGAIGGPLGMGIGAGVGALLGLL